MPADSPSYPAQPHADPLADQRERAMQALSLHFAHDRLTTEELERRLELAVRATTAPDLERLLADLPAGGQLATREDSARLAPSGELPAREALLAVLGGHSRRGSWLVPRQLKIWAVLGGAELDMRTARFAAGVSEIEVHAFLGGVEIVVPPWLNVECTGSAILGGFETSVGDALRHGTGGPLLRITGTAVMGGVEVKVALPEEKLE